MKKIIRNDKTVLSFARARTFIKYCPYLTALTAFYWAHKDFTDNLEHRPDFKRAYLKCLVGEGSDLIIPPLNCAQLIDGEAYFYWNRALSRNDISPHGCMTTCLLKIHYCAFNDPATWPNYFQELKVINPNSLTFM